jgi:hypothetical protein
VGGLCFVISINGAGCGGASTPAGLKSASTSAPPSSTGAAPAARSDDGAFTNVIETKDVWGELGLWAVDNALIVSDGKAGYFAVIQGDAVTPQPEIKRGLPSEGDGEDRGTVARVFGAWPDNLWLVWRYIGSWDEWYDRLFRLRAGGWVEVASSSQDYLYLDLWTQEGCVVGVRSNAGLHQASASAVEEEIYCEGGSKPHLVYGVGDPQRYKVVNARGFSTGDLLLLDFHTSPTLGNKQPGPRLWSFERSSGKRAPAELPLPEDVRGGGEPVVLLNTRVLARSRTDAYVVGNLVLESEFRKGNPGGAGGWIPPLVARFDSVAFSLTPSPPLFFIDEASLGSDGALALIGGANKDNRRERTVVMLGSDGAWKPLPLPQDSAGGGRYTPRQIVARSRSDIWVTAEGKGGRYALFRIR